MSNKYQYVAKQIVQAIESGEDGGTSGIADFLEREFSATAEADLAIKWGVSLNKDGKPLSRDVCHTINKRLEADLANAREVIAEMMEAVQAVVDCWERFYLEGDEVMEDDLTNNAIVDLKQKLAEQGKK